MNKIFLFLISVIIIFCSMSSHVQQVDSKAQATVNIVNGFYVFVDCKPNSDFDIVGSVDTKGESLNANGQYNGIRDFMIERAKEQFHLANGIVISFVDNKRDQAEAIRIK